MQKCIKIAQKGQKIVQITLKKIDKLIGYIEVFFCANLFVAAVP
jgi:hypothetical protein